MFYTAEEISTNIADDLLYINDLECRSMFNNVIENTNKEETLKTLRLIQRRLIDIKHIHQLNINLTNTIKKIDDYIFEKDLE
jgi:two-component sensor histidine kinase